MLISQLGLTATGGSIAQQDWSPHSADARITGGVSLCKASQRLDPDKEWLSLPSSSSPCLKTPE